MWFPTDTEVAAVVNGFYEIDFDEYRTDRVIQWISLTGPTGSTVSVFINTIFVDTTARGDFNRADYYSGMPLARGQQLRLIWSVGTGLPIPAASLGCSDGRQQVSVDQSGNADNPSIFTAGS